MPTLSTRCALASQAASVGGTTLKRFCAVAALAFVALAVPFVPAFADPQPSPTTPATVKDVKDAADAATANADTAWMLVSTGLVLLMVPGLALFYCGMVRKKNVLGTMMQSMVAL